MYKRQVEDSFKKGLFSYHQLRKKIADKIPEYDKHDKYHYVKEAQKKLTELYDKGREVCSTVKEAETVSYTHLDVYKRQLKKLLL